MPSSRHLLTIAVVAAVFVSLPGRAHPYHVTVAEVELNRSAHRLEVALRVIPEDLERGLFFDTERRVVLESTPDVEDLVSAYLEDRFFVEQEGARGALTWIGMEVSPKDAWLYFELGCDGTKGAATLTNRLFLDFQPDQLHTVSVKLAREKETFQLSREVTSAELEWRPGDAPEQPLPSLESLILWSVVALVVVWWGIG